MQILQGILRSGLEGIVFNPGHDSQLVLSQDLTKLLFREYALNEFRTSGGAWVPTQGESLLASELDETTRVVPVYVTERDAQTIASKCGGIATFHPWHSVRSRCREVLAEAAYLQFGFAEQIGVHMDYVNELAGPDEDDPLFILERIGGEGQDAGNAEKVCRALANLRQVWVLVDEENDIIALSNPGHPPLIDFFNSKAYAYQFLEEARRHNEGARRARAQIMPAEGIFRALAQVQPNICINRFSEGQWFGHTDTIPRVLQLMDM
jgi:hypothetical protein